MNGQNPNQNPTDSQTPQGSEPQNNLPQSGDGRNPAPQNPAPQNPAPQNPAPQNPAPQNGPQGSAHYYPPQTPYRWDYQNYAELEKKNRKKKNIGGTIALIISLIVIAALILFSVAMWNDYVGGPEDTASGELSGSVSSPTANAPEISIGGNAGVSVPSVSGPIPSEYLSVADIAAKVRPSVVGVCSYAEEYPFMPIGEGSGIIASSDGYIITNHHVINDADGIVVVLENGKKYEAQLVGGDAYTDLAVIRIKASNLKAAVFGDPSKMKVGDFVVAIGNPGGTDFAGSVTYGIISALNRPLQSSLGIPMNCIQTDAAINPGNSGGALVNIRGEIVGINSSKIVSEGYENMGFAISMNEAQPILNQLIKHGRVTDRVWLGVSVQELDQVTSRLYQVPIGLIAMEVDEKSAVYKAGLRKGDVLTQMDGVQLEFGTDLTQLLSRHKPGETVTFKVYRADKLKKGKTLTIRVKLEPARTK